MNMRESILTEKELEVLRLRQGGFKNAEIAERLHVSRADISQTFKRLAKKIDNVKNSVLIMKELGILKEKSIVDFPSLRINLEAMGEDASRDTNLQYSAIALRRHLSSGGVEHLTRKPKTPEQTVSRFKVDYTVDLTKIGGDGEFPCPKCSIIIDPGAKEEEENYDIVQTTVKGEELVSLVLKCKKCGSLIKLIGFLESDSSEAPEVEIDETLHEVDLRSIKGQQSFACPKCGNNIDPKKVNSEVYRNLMEGEDGKIGELLLICPKCGSRLKLVGFAEYTLNRLLSTPKSKGV
jgi:DNA-binding CsgD family transcriptional regulator/DNA-directed RNA polymerase subunit M/transcription elongation factor TFIIS